MVRLDRCNRTCKIVEDAFVRICIPIKIEDTNFNAYNMIKEINDSKKLFTLFFIAPFLVYVCTT